jgi:hypothetical protein
MITSLLFAVPIVQRSGPRVGLIGSSWTYLFFVAARALPVDSSLRLYAMYVTAVGVGAGGAVLWTCIGMIRLVASYSSNTVTLSFRRHVPLHARCRRRGADQVLQRQLLRPVFCQWHRRLRNCFRMREL